MSDFEVLERAAAGGALLLRVERLGLAGGDERVAPAFLLTFDVGRILLTADALAGKLDTLHIPSPEEVPGGLESADEDEPWWRLLGAPLRRAESLDEGGDRIRLQFRADHENPRRVLLERKGGSVHVKLEA